MLTLVHTMAMLWGIGALCNVLWAHGVLQTLTPELFDKICAVLEAKALADFKPHVSAACPVANPLLSLNVAILDSALQPDMFMYAWQHTSICACCTGL